MTKNVNEVLDLAGSLRTKTNNVGAKDELKVDPHFIEDKKATPVIEYGIKRRKNILIVGPTGCGKSSLAINIAARLKEQFEIFSCSGETTVDELIGKPWKVEQKGIAVTIPVYGSGVRAYRDGKGLLLEEVDFPNPDVHASLHRLLEPSQKFLHVNIGEPETIQRHRNFFTIATANTIGSGEDNFLYAGTKVLNAAFLNRFSLTINLDFLDSHEEIKVLMNKTGIEKSIAIKLVNVASDARRRQKEDSVDRIASILSTRDLIEWADALVGMQVHPLIAAEYAFLNRMPEADRDVVKKLVEYSFR